MKIRSSALGFTLMELILVIVLLSILSLFAASRFMGSGNFSAYALQERVISVIRQVQVNRMQSNISIPNKPYPERCLPSSYKAGEDSSYTNFCLSITSTCIGSSAACNLASKERDARSDVVVDNSAQFSIINGASSPIEFDLLGNPLNVSSAGISILIQDKNSQSQCRVLINPQGYVSEGACS
ncbi:MULTISPECIES: type II secretion system protein [Vibrio]|uniref:type II secretion system protein n=1 Tax=Vibrio TaxID=662 RepID=UPI001CDD66AE|nr:MULTISPECIES: type II secretion system protein [Vibrio]EIK0774024.1 type II secretion system protein [Vibrio alginolyticus]ELA7317309.1 type II secretion system protein [Vibrio alginolyticus]MCA2490669.1 type II secretion system GspH family protein [Vibrio alginolyticus]MDW1783089.1 type II secretion system protein [Vibrio sp. Vb2134]MDW2087768.1 type II secretion system protein [Vibrio sp. 2134-1]